MAFRDSGTTKALLPTDILALAQPVSPKSRDHAQAFGGVLALIKDMRALKNAT
jgi:hypothetical protein